MQAKAARKLIAVRFCVCDSSDDEENTGSTVPLTVRADELLQRN
jgi:hypothetical protein